MPRILIKDLDNTEKGPFSDMKLYFGSTFVKVSIDGESPPKWSKYAGPGHEGHSFILFDGKSVEVQAKHEKAYVEWFFPTGWYNTKKSSVFCERIPKRQYQKGLHHGLNFQAISAETLTSEHGMLESDDPKMKELAGKIKIYGMNVFNTVFIQNTFENPVYPSLEEAYVLLKSKKVFSRALNSEFALIPHPVTKDCVVFCHDFPVAELVTKNKLKMIVPEFKPECLAYFQKEGVSVVS